MNVTDPISDMLTRIRNASSAHHKVTRIPGSNLKLALARILKETGYIEEFSFVEDSRQGEIEVILKYDDYGNSIIRGIKRVSKPGLRQYVNRDKIPKVLSGYGIAIISTSQGVITDKDAKKRGIGGEVLCYIW